MKREQNSRFDRHNGVRFFRGLRREKVAPFEAVEVRPEGNVSVWGPPENMLSSQACLSH
jgi:hypothetical protein